MTLFVDDNVTDCSQCMLLRILNNKYVRTYIYFQQISTSSLSVLPPSYILHSCARFAHSEHYIRTISLHHGFIILKSKICTIRKNQGKDVMGYLIVLQKPAQII